MRKKSILYLNGYISFDVEGSGVDEERLEGWQN